MLTPEDRNVFEKFLKRNQLKLTRQREIILDVFFEGEGSHTTVEDLYQQVRSHQGGIGFVTVYRTMKLLEEAGLAKQRHFGNASALYEPARPAEHHDHLICTECGKIVEFEQCDIEALQEEVAAQHRFTIHTHRLEIYGKCDTCSDSSG